MLRIFVLFITFLGISNAAFGEECGLDYPADLECLPGGTYQKTVDMMSIAKSIVITYEMPKEKLYKEVRSLLERSDWVADEWREEQEAEGTRYRVSIAKGDRKIGIAIFGPGKTSVLQVTLILARSSQLDDA